MVEQGKTTWLLLGEAARRLNVHPTTLRRWAANGDIPVMVTPGGHRRFAAADVEQIAQSQHGAQRIPDIKEVFTSEALQKTRNELGQPEQQAWLTRFSDEERARHRQLGKRLMGVMLQYVSQQDDTTGLVDEAGRIGIEYGKAALQMGTPLTDALKASMFFRDALVDTTLHLPEKVRIRPEAKSRLLHRINKILNTVQLAIAEVYDGDKTDRLSGS